MLRGIPYDPQPIVPPGVVSAETDSATVPADVRRKPYQLDPLPLGDSAPAGGGWPLGPPSREVDALPGHLYRPRGAFVIDLPLNRIPQTILAGASAVLALWPKVPQGQLGVVDKLGFVVTAGTLADAKLYTLKNGAPVNPYTGTVGSLGTLEVPQPCGIELDAGDVFSVLVVNTGANPLDVAVRSVGWFYGGGAVR
jgi:hypothetical protein